MKKYLDWRRDQGHCGKQSTAVQLASAMEIPLMVQVLVSELVRGALKIRWKSLILNTGSDEVHDRSSSVPAYDSR